MRNFSFSPLRWSAICALAVLALLVLLGPSRDSASEEGLQSGTALATNEPGVCTRLRTPRCMIDIRYAYPAADLSLVPEELYF